MNGADLPSQHFKINTFTSVIIFPFLQNTPRTKDH